MAGRLALVLPGAAFDPAFGDPVGTAESGDGCGEGVTDVEFEIDDENEDDPTDCD
jgi:hypothetical protein